MWSVAETSVGDFVQLVADTSFCNLSSGTPQNILAFGATDLWICCGLFIIVRNYDLQVNRFGGFINFENCIRFPS